MAFALVVTGLLIAGEGYLYVYFDSGDTGMLFRSLKFIALAVTAIWFKRKEISLVIEEMQRNANEIDDWLDRS